MKLLCIPFFKGRTKQKADHIYLCTGIRTDANWHRNLLLSLNFIPPVRIIILPKQIQRKRKLTNSREADSNQACYIRHSDDEMDFPNYVIHVLHTAVEKTLGENVGDVDAGDSVELVHEPQIAEDDEMLTH